MNVIDVLIDEHKLVRRYLDTISIAIDLLGAGEDPPGDFFEKLLDFSNTFLDTYHHFKEEYVVFLKLAEKQGGAIDGQIVSLRNQHERGRDFVNKIAASIEGYERGSEVERAKLFENLGYFFELQRQHLNRENHVFFPMARKAFSDKELDEFAEEFKKEDKRLGPETFEYCKRLVELMSNQLEDIFGDIYRKKAKQLEKTRAHK